MAENSKQLRQSIDSTKHCEFGHMFRFAYGLQKGHFRVVLLLWIVQGVQARLKVSLTY